MRSCDKDILEQFEFRNIKPDEIDQAIDIEQICFPPNEACSPESMRARVEMAPECFLVAVDRQSGRLAGFLNGLATKEDDFRDEFFTDVSLHDSAGDTVMLLGLDVLPEYRRKGLARQIVYQYCERERDKGRKLLCLTCLPDKVAMYKKLGFTNRGKANSIWGGEEWYEMICTL